MLLSPRILVSQRAVRHGCGAMAGSTRRQQAATAATATLGVLTGAAALGGRMRLCGVGLAVIASADLLVGLEARRRPVRLEKVSQTARCGDASGAPPQGDHVGSERQANQDEDSLRTDATLRRVLAAVEGGRLEAADRHAELLALQQAGRPYWADSARA